MAKNKTQPKIEAFLQEMTAVCQKYGMCVDANGGGGRRGEGQDRGEARFNEGCPLVLYTQSGEGPNYRKVGYLWYSFLGAAENLTYNFDPKRGTPYKEIVIPEPVEDLDQLEEIKAATPLKPEKAKKPEKVEIPPKPILDEMAGDKKEKAVQLPASALAKAIFKAKEWQKDNNIKDS